jgi:hypothetical protein
VAERIPEPAEERTPFERFADLTRKVVGVPKAEVDALRKKQQKTRRRRATTPPQP